MKNGNNHISNLNQSNNWIDYLKENSGLPGKRANLELMKTVVDLGDEHFFNTCLEFNEEIAPTNTEGEFVAMCGVTGLGKLLNEGKYEYLDVLREFSSDGRWRVREGVVLALQLIGEENFSRLVHISRDWIKGNHYEKRAIVAGLCEPKLLKDRLNVESVFEILEEIMESIEQVVNRKTEMFKVLRKGLGYGLSVAIVAYPKKGKQLFERLKEKSDKDINWILNENLRKKRLEKMDKCWTDNMKDAIA